jgi:hypothetical protein
VNALHAREQVARLNSEGASQLPNRSQSDGAPRLNALVVPEAEASVHHVFLSQAAARSDATHAPAELDAEMREVAFSQAATTVRNQRPVGPRLKMS